MTFLGASLTCRSVSGTSLFIYLHIRLTNIKHVLCFYLDNKVFLSRNYRLIIAPRKFDGLKTNICRPLNVPPRTISKITESRILPSLSWGIFSHVTCLDKSRASKNLFQLFNFVLTRVALDSHATEKPVAL